MIDAYMVSIDSSNLFSSFLITAWHALSLLNDIEGSTILVTGAASCVGDYVTQLASRERCATVIGTVGSELKAEHAHRSGAAHTIDYKVENVADRILEITAHSHRPTAGT